MAAAKSSATRVIVHLDLDCFYAQVEQRRLNIPRDQPVAVQQWGSLLAINYVARKFGVGRGDNITEARKKCPSIHLPHVETLGENRKPGSTFDRTHQKAILRRYRMASKEIFEILGRFAPICERGSIDEAYLDLTQQVLQRIQTLDSISSDFCADAINGDTKVVGVTPLDGVGKDIDLDTFTAFPLTEEERLLCVGATIAREIRQTIFDELGFTCSVGVATNKLVAKLASPLNKPNGQTILAPRFIPPFMHHFPIRKVRGLGGKLGKQLVNIYYKIKGEDTMSVEEAPQDPTGAVPVEKPSVTMSAFVESCSMEDLVAHLGRETAVYVRNVCTGDDGDEPVNGMKTDVKGFMAAKQYEDKSRLQDVEQLKYWLPILADEVVERCEEEKTENKRFPAQISVNYTRVGAKTKSRHFSIALDATIDSVVKGAMTSLQHDVDSMFPCSSLSISVKDFMPMSSRAASISTFFTKVSGEQRTASQFHETERLPTTSQSIPPPKKRKISSFFGAPSNEGSSSTEEPAPEGSVENEPAIESSPFFCDACNKFVYESKQEHADFHYALRLSQGTNGASSATVSSGQKAKKPRSGPMDTFLSR
ncbi:hypothetical protein Poli38472_011284 [Pythium oligandrum]|uniref:DNA polymerase eta n=1 Tax=Pythium oligandrum TaxID=41045 RepID=A0A8K1FNT6_PYTOL|nr:hypothetical protein Poli38472_014846 [Pythium oligandrum]TMW67664.1 hypothetical protein Poli38472_011284 [Pythium oligandrum]|eukprot:TMW54938.1 hypothetical protein Poli38472_014846 [Pythium oligandrum]